MHLHSHVLCEGTYTFQKLNSICHFSDHSINLLRSSCKCCLSASLFNFPKHFCVVRKLQHLACYVIIQIIDIYIKNKIGPSTDPCGTPLKTGFQFETSPSTTTLCLLSISHFSIQLIIPFPMPWAFSLSSSLWGGTLSKAF